jgi:hypothetical protein
LPDEHKISENQMEEMQKQNAARGHPAERSGMEDRVSIGSREVKHALRVALSCTCVYLNEADVYNLYAP